MHFHGIRAETFLNAIKSVKYNFKILIKRMSIVRPRQKLPIKFRNNHTKTVWGVAPTW